ncbi:MAG: hypothetical protein J6K22_02820 [Spirochaetaceae bacterium]|nr:hypothetical protein [Spirochaetaceae bacterium]
MKNTNIQVKDILDDFFIFCKKEFPQCYIHYNKDKNWFWVQASLQFSSLLHFEYKNGDLKLHIEILDKQEKKLLINFLSKQDLLKDKLKKTFFILESNIITKEVLFEKLKYYKRKINKILNEYNQQKNKIKTIIVVIAPRNKGKTTCIKEFYVNLIQKHSI